MTATINIANKGSAPATNLKLTLNAPGVIDDYDVNGTEDYEEVYNSTSLVLNIPRLVHGQGSMVKVILELKNISSTGSDNYTAYATYDQGSLREDAPAIQYQGQQTLVSPRNYLSNLGDTFWLIIYAIITGVIGFIIDKLYKMHRTARVIDTSPPNGSYNIPIFTPIWVRFDKPVSYVKFDIKDNRDNKVQGTVKKATESNIVQFSSEQPLLHASAYSVEIIANRRGSRRETKHAWAFVTDSIPKPEEAG